MRTPPSKTVPVPSTQTAAAPSRARFLTNGRRRDTATPQLTSRERSLLALLETELSYTQIATRLGMRPNTMKSHIKNIFEKTGVRSRHAVVAWHLRRLLTPQGD